MKRRAFRRSRPIITGAILFLIFLVYPILVAHSENGEPKETILSPQPSLIAHVLPEPEPNKVTIEVEESEYMKKQEAERLRQLEDKKLLAKKQAEVNRLSTLTKPQAKVPYSSNLTASWVDQCRTWANMAGIHLSDAAIRLIDRESDCNPTVRNPSSSAGGIPQSLPYTKMGCALAYTDEAAICQLKWMQGYVFKRYGSWEAALNHSLKLGWY